MDNRAIGIFDSGFGGLTGLKRLREIAPEENVIYFADSGRMPYGPRPEEQICSMTGQILDFLKAQDVKYMIAACGTISSAAEAVLKGCSVEVVGVMDPGVEAMAALPGDAPLGIIATAASIATGKFKARLQALCPGREIIDVPCPEFARLIEEGHTRPDDEVLMPYVREYLAPFMGRNIAGLMMGCTHYGIISDAIRSVLGEEPVLVSASGAAAEKCMATLEKRGMTGKGGKLRLYTSGDGDALRAFATPLLNEGELDIVALAPMEVLA